MGWSGFSPAGKAPSPQEASRSQRCPSTLYHQLVMPSAIQTHWVHTHKATQSQVLKGCPCETASGLPLSICLCKFTSLHIQTYKQWSIFSSYMLLFFRGELMELFLCWLREPPMATDESVFVSGLSQILCTSSRASPLPLLQTARLSVRAPQRTASHHDWLVIILPASVSCPLPFSVDAAQSTYSGVWKITHE